MSRYPSNAASSSVGRECSFIPSTWEQQAARTAFCTQQIRARTILSVWWSSRSKLVRGQLKVPKVENRNSDRSSERIFLHAIADHFGPAMLIDAGCRILHSHGPVSHFINFPSGAPEMNLAQLIVPELANEILTTLNRARRKQSSAYSRN